LSLKPNTGIIAGTPPTAGTFKFTVQLKDANSATTTRALSIVIAPVLSITAAALPNGTVNTAYSRTLAATGGTTPYNWSVSAGALPDGLTLNTTTGVISGTPITAGPFSFTVQVADALLATTAQTLSITIVPAPLITPATLASGLVGTAYNQTLAATGGTTPYSWSVSAGALPGGLTLNATTGIISGTPTTAGTFNFTVRLGDALLASTTLPLSIIVSLPPPPVVPSSFAVTAARGTGNKDTATLTWTENPNTAASFTIQRATNAGFTTGLATMTAAGTATSYQDTGPARLTTYWYRIQAVNPGGASAWCTAVSVTTP
jgi:hypothetical protein